MTNHRCDSCLPDSSLIAGALRDSGIDDVDIHVFEQLESTSQWLQQNQNATLPEAEKALRTQLCVTDSQVAGIGRRGKTWQSLPGNITFSIYSASARHAQDLMGLSLVTGIAVAETLQEALSLPVQLKWPNDLVFDDAKLGGLLTEILSKSSGVKKNEPGDSDSSIVRSEIITGVGINVRRDPEVSVLGMGAVSLEEAHKPLTRGNRDHLIGTISANILNAQQRFEHDGWSVFENQWKQLDWLADTTVLIHRESSTEPAIARGVNEKGALLVERNGIVEPLYGGQVSIRRKV